MAKIYNVYEPEYVTKPGVDYDWVELTPEESKHLFEEQECEDAARGYRKWEPFIKFHKVTEDPEEMEGFPVLGPFEGEQINYPFFHGTNAPPEHILQDGLNPLTNLSLSPSHAGMYGRYIYRVDVPENWPLGWGAGRDEFWVVRRIHPRYLSVFADREGEQPETEVWEELHSHMREVIERGRGRY